MLSAVAGAADVWTRLVADPRLSREERLGIAATVQVLEDQLGLLLGIRDLPGPEQSAVSTASARVGRVEKQYQDLEEMAARLDAIAGIAKEHARAETEA